MNCSTKRLCIQQGELIAVASTTLYVFLVLVADRNGLSYYCYDKICTLLRLSVDEYILARNTLIDKDLIAFDGYLFQVLSLPQKLVADQLKPLTSDEDMHTHDPAVIRRLIEQSLTNYQKAGR